LRRSAVFLDRDGTLVEEAGYLDRLERLEFFPFTVDAVRALNVAGLPVVVISNQSGVARGIVRESFIAETHEHILRRLAAGGAHVDGFYYCPHHPDGTVEALRKQCDCRKPATGMFTRAARDLGLDLGVSFALGDKWTDMEAGRAVGARTILVRTGYGRETEAAPRRDFRPDAIVDNMIEAVSWILRVAA
jgi:D-glycero-D-manno-heptose 1,7-bisphosphate phosphatase